MINNEAAREAAALPEEDARLLAGLGWNERVGDKQGIWVSIERQTMCLIENHRIVWQAPCSTAAAGTGAERNSMKTPLGWHRVAGKLGAGAPWGQVFRSRKMTHEVWKQGGDSKEDLVLTRVFLLDGEEPGKNKGRNAAGVSVDSLERCIYIHGTNAEQLIGHPASHGCIRLRNDDVIAAFERIAEGTPLLIQ